MFLTLMQMVMAIVTAIVGYEVVASIVRQVVADRRRRRERGGD